MTRKKNFFVQIDSKESSEKRVSRFKQWFNRARISDQVKEGRYHEKPLTKREIRETALIRESHRTEREKSKYYL